jgi:acyl-CoA synthetase (AMP-forming)/AMP-acid ligase II
MYGLTEAFRSTYLDPAELERKTGSIGKALPNQEMVVLRPDGSLCAPGEAGELVHRGSLVTLGYWNDDAETAKRFRPLPAGASNAPPTELAVWSGDLVRADEEGFLYFVGRVDHMIKTSGYRVSPTEVEEVIAEVEGVMEVAAVGLPDPVIGQRIVVALVAKPGADASLVEQLRRHCRMHLPAYMAPQEFVLVDSIERGPNGKPDRGALLQRLASEAAKRQSTPAPLGAIA